MQAYATITGQSFSAADLRGLREMERAFFAARADGDTKGAARARTGKGKGDVGNRSWN